MGKGHFLSPQRPRIAKTEFLPERHSLNLIMKIQIGKPKNEEQPQNMACTFQNISVMKDKAEHLLPIKGAQRKRQLDAMCVPALEHES